MHANTNQHKNGAVLWARTKAAASSAEQQRQDKQYGQHLDQQLHPQQLM